MSVSAASTHPIEARFEYSPILPKILAHARCSLLVSTYQSRKVFVIGTREGKLDVSFLDYEQPMGIAAGPTIAIGDRSQIHLMRSQHDAIQANASLRLQDSLLLQTSSLSFGN